ncbi:MAG: acetyl-CoA carboxylase biotin carboxylase subunit [Planctomycetota bacterium]
MFRKVLIANRGEIALRVMRACRERGLRTVAVYSDADANAPHVRFADEAVRLGPAPPSESYLKIDAILRAAKDTGAEAIHPGFGFLSENAGFAEAVRGAGLIFIGPSADVVRSMGSKTEARALMQRAGVPVVPGTEAGADDQVLIAAAKDIGYPLMVKASAGGGGKGMRIVREAGALEAALSAARREAKAAFADDTIFLERYVERPRHIEFQVFGDEHGNIVHLFERECSIQRRHQKIVEETPSPALDESLRQKMGEAAVAAARAVGYTNAGTVELLLGPDGDFYFLEMNTRLQVEHPVTELATGIDLVGWQLRIAAGEPLPRKQDELRQLQHAIEVRIYAEDPAAGFLPVTGTAEYVREPKGPGIRVDGALESRQEIPIHYDPMLAKLIAWGADRPSAIARMKQALADYVVLGVTTNIEFLREVIAHEAFAKGETDTGFIDRNMPSWKPKSPAPTDEVLLALAAGESARKSERSGAAGPDDGDRFSPWQTLGPWRPGGAA